MGGSYSCTMEFWMMSIVLPFGVALFQANNIQLLNMVTQQRRFIEEDSNSVLPAEQHGSTWDSLPKLVRSSLSNRAGIAITLGIILQVRYLDIRDP